MTKKEAIEYFGGVRQMAEALETWPQAVYRWRDPLPKGRQFEIQVKSNGKLRADHDQK